MCDSSGCTSTVYRKCLLPVVLLSLLFLELSDNLPPAPGPCGTALENGSVLVITFSVLISLT